MIGFRSNKGIIRDMRIAESFFEETGLYMVSAYFRKKQIGILKGIIREEIAYLGDIDIQKRYISIGVGSQLIKVFEEKCYQRNIKEIKGDLSNVDLDHKERLVHFYEKHNYQIIYGNEEKTNYWGKIYKRI